MLGLKKRKDDALDEPSEDKAPPKRIRKKKDEPAKPWGRGERYLVFGVLFATILLSAFLALSAREWKLPGLPRIALPNNMFQETYVFEGKSTKKDTSHIQNTFNEMSSQAAGVYGFYVVNLNTDESYGVNADETFQAASLIKLPVMAALYKEHERNNIDIDSEYSLKNEDRVGGAGSIYYAETGKVYTYRELIWYMGQQSDNTAFRASVNLLGEENVQEYIFSFGMEHTSYEENETTPRDIGIFFKKLWERKIIDRANRDELLKSLTNTGYENLIPAGIPTTRISHKYGSELHVLNDAGIVFATDPYVLVIMSKGIVESEAFELIPQMAALINKFETSGVN